LNERLTKEAGQQMVDQLVGKPLVVYIDGERKQIGTIINARVVGDKLYCAGQLDTGEELEAAVGEIFEAVHDED
jgi:hypothetical protein